MTTPTGSGPSLTVVVAGAAAGWLPEFFDHLIAEPHRDWEGVVVVAEDADRVIAEHYARRDDRFTIHQFTGSPADSRALGMAHATGRTVNFADPTRVPTGDQLGPLVASLLRSDSDLALAQPLTDARFAGRARADGGGLTVISDPELILRQIDAGAVLRTSFLRENSIEWPSDTAHPQILWSIRVLASARSIDLVPSASDPRPVEPDTVESEVRLAADWLDQANRALDVVGDLPSDRAGSVFATALLAGELWSLLRRFNQVEDPLTLPRLSHVIQRCIDTCGRESLEALPALQRVALEHAGGGGLERSWRSAGWWLNPYSHRVPSLAYRAIVVANAIRMLDRHRVVDRRLGDALVWTEILRPLVAESGPLSSDTAAAVLRGLAGIWSVRPDMADHAEGVLMSALRVAADGPDHDSMREAIRFERSIGPARVARVRPAGRDFFIEGTLDSSIRLTPEVTVELVLRSRSSPKVRTRSAWAGRSGDGPLIRWQVRVPSGAEWQDEEWAAWVRVTDAGLPDRDQPVRYVTVPESIEVAARTSSLRLDRSHDLSFTITAAPRVPSN